MKALSLWQPWATLMAIEAKRFETRDWPTQYRGVLAIHATKGFPSKDDERSSFDLFGTEPFSSVLAAAGYQDWHQLERGAIVGVGVLLSVNPTEWLVKRTAGQAFYLSEQERALGNYDPQRFGWEVAGMRRLPTPIAAVGMQKLWVPPDAVRAELETQIGGFSR